LSRCDKRVRVERTEWAAPGRPLRRSTRRNSSQRDEFHLMEMPHIAISKCAPLSLSAATEKFNLLTLPARGETFGTHYARTHRLRDPALVHATFPFN